MIKLLYMAIRLSWSREPFSRWRYGHQTLAYRQYQCPILSLCRRTVEGYFQQWHSIEYLWYYCFLKAWSEIKPDLQPRIFFWTIPLRWTFFMQRICDDINRTAFKWYAVVICIVINVNVTVEQKCIINKDIKQQGSHYWSLRYTGFYL